MAERSDEIGRIEALAGRFMAKFGRPLAVVISAAMLIVILHEIRSNNFAAVRLLPLGSPGFWLAFIASYLASPMAEWVIYSRIWGFEWNGLPILIRKLVSNELLLGYLGELQLLTWAQQRYGSAANPLAVIKDVSIISGLTGNAVTVALLAISWPLLARSGMDAALQKTYWPMAIVLLFSLAILLLRRRVFSLPLRELALISIILIARTMLALTMTALIWHQVLPETALSVWFLLTALRMVISRLPLVPSKELLFAALTVVLLGNSSQISGLVAALAALVLLSHLLIGGALSLSDLIRLRRGAPPIAP